MARSFVTDPLLTCDFALMEVPVSGLLPLAFGQKVVESALSNANFIGFQSLGVPTPSMETKTVKEGNWPFIHEVPLGFQAGGEVTLRHAVTQTQFDMWLWWKQATLGRFAPRRHLMAVHTRRDKRLPARIIAFWECIPKSWQPSSDLDANASTVAVETMTFYTEKVDIIPVPIDRSLGANRTSNVLGA